VNMATAVDHHRMTRNTCSCGTAHRREIVACRCLAVDHETLPRARFRPAKSDKQTGGLRRGRTTNMATLCRCGSAEVVGVTTCSARPVAPDRDGRHAVLRRSISRSARRGRACSGVASGSRSARGAGSMSARARFAGCQLLCMWLDILKASRPSLALLLEYAD
jgi:hypothetical protein